MKAAKLGLLSVGLIFGLSACDLINPGGGPRINSFTADPPTITAGQSSVLSWNVDSSATSVSITGAPAITGDTGTVTVTPTQTTQYTLTARSAEGTSTRAVTVTVSGGNGGGGSGGGGGGGGGSTGDGSFGVSTSATGPFLNDTGDQGPIISDDDDRIISVAAGSTFYAQVQYEDPAGIQSISINLVNSSPDGFRGPLPLGGFEVVGEPTGDCDLGSATSVTCVYQISVAPGTPDIETLPGAGGEFAYVLRPSITNGAGTATLLPVRGYVNVTP